MMREEFESLTGFYPSSDMYRVIEKEYYKFGGFKREFCKAFVKNTGGIAERIQREADQESYRQSKEALDAFQNLVEQNEQLAKQKAEVEWELEKEQEWREYEDKHNVKQEQYAELASDKSTSVLSEEDAKKMVCEWFGFAYDKVEILYTVDREEINRHGQIRKSGVYGRAPLYNATDWNYICFRCTVYIYEMVDGELRMFCN